MGGVAKNGAGTELLHSWGSKTYHREKAAERVVREMVLNMLVPWRALNGRHKSTAMCRSGADRRRRRLAETEVRESTEMAFEVYRDQLQTVPSFKYLWIILTEGGNDWPAVAVNLGKAQKSWGRMQRILSREGGKQESVGEFL